MFGLRRKYETHGFLSVTLHSGVRRGVMARTDSVVINYLASIPGASGLKFLDPNQLCGHYNQHSRLYWFCKKNKTNQNRKPEFR